jgi:hypothetical protein
MVLNVSKTKTMACVLVQNRNFVPHLMNSNLSGEEYMYYKTEFSFCDSIIS